jgi:hypothetical protein
MNRISNLPVELQRKILKKSLQDKNPCSVRPGDKSEEIKNKNDVIKMFSNKILNDMKKMIEKTHREVKTKRMAIYLLTWNISRSTNRDGSTMSAIRDIDSYIKSKTTPWPLNYTDMKRLLYIIFSRYNKDILCFMYNKLVTLGYSNLIRSLSSSMVDNWPNNLTKEMDIVFSKIPK